MVMCTLTLAGWTDIGLPVAKTCQKPRFLPFPGKWIECEYPAVHVISWQEPRDSVLTMHHWRCAACGVGPYE